MDGFGFGFEELKERLASIAMSLPLQQFTELTWLPKYEELQMGLLCWFRITVHGSTLGTYGWLGITVHGPTLGTYGWLGITVHGITFGTYGWLRIPVHGPTLGTLAGWE